MITTTFEWIIFDGTVPDEIYNSKKEILMQSKDGEYCLGWFRKYSDGEILFDYNWDFVPSKDIYKYVSVEKLS